MYTVRLRLSAAFLLLILWTSATLAFAQARLVRGVATVRITVRDLNRSLDFYTRVLPFKKAGEAEFSGEDVEHLFGLFGVHARTARLELGDEQIELIEFLAPSGRDIEPTSTANDRWFQHVAIIVRDMDAAYAVLRQNHVRFASSEPQRLPDWNKNAGGIKAFYFRDPDGHFLELLQFPEGKEIPNGIAARTICSWASITLPLSLQVRPTACISTAIYLVCASPARARTSVLSKNT